MNRISLPLRVILSVAILLFITGILITLYFFNPENWKFYPRCPFNILTGFYCSGCGTTRAIHLMLHGELSAAFGKNQLTPFLLIILGYISGRNIYYPLKKGTAPPVIAPRLLIALVIIIVSYWILRNIPAPPFTLLAP